MSDVDQLPPVAMKSIVNDSNPNSSCSADTTSKIAFSKFIYPHNQLESINFILHMTDVVRKKDEQFKNILFFNEKWNNNK